jgi:DNA-binding NarL/FixJ family response regulator
MKKKTTILLAEDHLIVREGLRKLLELETDFTVVGEASDGREAVKKVAELHPHIVVMDIALPLLNGIEACRQIRKSYCESRVLILSAHGDDTYVEESMEAGASGFVLKQAPGSALAQAIREVDAGRQYFSAAILRRYHQPQTGLLRTQSPTKRPRLTPRESEVLQLIAEGKANKETAFEMGISIKTVEKHRTNLMQKLNLHDTASLTRYAIGEGIIESITQNTVI